MPARIGPARTSAENHSNRQDPIRSAPPVDSVAAAVAITPLAPSIVAAVSSITPPVPSTTAPDVATTPATPWIALSRLAGEQHGVVSRRQARAAGLSDRQIDRALAAGRIHSVHRGVFAVGHSRLSVSGNWSAAVLAGGDRAALGYRAAGAFWGLRPSSSPEVDIIARRASPVSRTGLVVHRHPGLKRDETVRQDGIVVTTVARTLLDLAAVVSEYQLRRAIKHAEVQRLFDLHTVRVLLRRHPRHRGARLLGDVLRTWIDPPKTRSVLEERFPAFCTRHGLPQPIMNGTIGGYEIDAHFPVHRVAVEFDGYRFHQGIISWEDDHERRNRLVAAGWEYLSFTYRQQTDDGGRAVLETLRPTMRRREPPAGESR